MLKQEVETLRHQADHYLFHEHLEEVNDPLYFHELAERGLAKGLQYLGEARVGTMVLSNFGPDIEKTLKMLATDQIMVEQYMDFLRNRMFRETLLCHAKITPNWSIQPKLKGSSRAGRQSETPAIASPSHARNWIVASKVGSLSLPCSQRRNPSSGGRVTWPQWSPNASSTAV